MNAKLYTIFLQWKMDIRSRTLLITCYMVPLLFFAIMGGIFTSIDPTAKNTLIQSMTIMGVSMGAFVGMPPSIVEIYAGDIKKAYKVHGIPMYFPLFTLFISSFIHLFIMSIIILIIAPIAFNAAIPSNLGLYLMSLIMGIVIALSIGCVLGLLVKSQSRLTMISQILFLPSIMLSGIMFPTDLLPSFFGQIGKMIPATWAYMLMTASTFDIQLIYPQCIIFIVSICACYFLIRKQEGGE